MRSDPLILEALRETIAVCCGNCAKYTNSLCVCVCVCVGGGYSLNGCTRKTVIKTSCVFVSIDVFISKHVNDKSQDKYSRVSFCDGSFYDDSLLLSLPSRTEHSRLVMHHCRNSSVLSLLSALLVLCRCASVSSFSILVQFF